MRYKIRPSPKMDEERVIEKFLWWPLTINDEIRWLELAKIKQRYCRYGAGKLSPHFYWQNINWEN